MTDAELDALIAYARSMPEGWSLHKYADAITVLREQVAAKDDKIKQLRIIGNVNGDWNLKYGAAVDRAERAEAENAALREALIDVLASLVAAHSLLEGGGKKAAASDKMFYQMLKDYAASIARGRAALLAGKESKP